MRVARVSATLILTALLYGCVAPGPLEEPPQVSAIRQMRAVLKDADYERFYAECCHPHIHAQMDAREFREFMEIEEGQHWIELMERVIKALDENAGNDVLIAQPQEKEDEYEFIFVPVRDTSYIRRQGQCWHVELKLDHGEWKLMDVD